VVASKLEALCFAMTRSSKILERNERCDAYAFACGNNVDLLSPQLTEAFEGRQGVSNNAQTILIVHVCRLSDISYAITSNTSTVTFHWRCGHLSVGFHTTGNFHLLERTP